MKKTTAIIGALIITASAAYASMKMEEGFERITVFTSQTDKEGWTAVLKGKIVSYSSKDEFDQEDLIGSSQEKSKATVRLYNREGVSEGNILYVINDKNLIVAKMKVRTVFKTVSFGDMLVGYGNFRLGSVGDRVIQKAEDENAKYAYIYKARGDYYDNTGGEGEAIREYKEALKLDKNNPEAHLALGMIYLKQGLDQFAIKEFQESYRNMARLYDKSDKFQLLENMAQVRYREVYESFLPQKLKDKYRDEGKKYCGEALRINPASEKINYLLGVFHYRSPNPDDKIARDYFLKVIEINPLNADAFVSLAELYYRHENQGKARLYAEKALEADPTNPRAQKMVKYLDSKLEVK
ncbi:MAG TPA: tetratricopeptide repeat protein [Spirochaetota bacterium]|nr:tetratricopeptide repeat protein [Spirochaetota bacterium]HOD14176.1 tetratricopeptide repeat protein [Spirochaetota bacterium]HPG52181.1 tetratricopeptide repeat protein [Spirochaetota bacterium]HPN13122.1 tetratricopeptide repeat protein [Spirochaetota bacterium]HQL82830.1 tetratricopeptide repeat protein [Spirochaetota bacterium]